MAIVQVYFFRMMKRGEGRREEDFSILIPDIIYRYLSGQIRTDCGGALLDKYRPRRPTSWGESIPVDSGCRVVGESGNQVKGSRHNRASLKGHTILFLENQ